MFVFEFRKNLCCNKNDHKKCQTVNKSAKVNKNVTNSVVQNLRDFNNFTDFGAFFCQVMTGVSDLC